MPIKVGMVSLGCTKNQVDAEIMLSLITKQGYELCGDAKKCDVVIINTCGFIEDAKRESIENILEFVGLKEQGRVKVVVVTGCLAERYQMEVAKEIPEADVVLGIGSNSQIAQAIEKAMQGQKVYEFADKNKVILSGERVMTTAPYTAYLKVAEGCDNRCTYCAIPIIRGGFRSRPMEDVLAEAKTLAKNGVKELNVIAQDTTRYGKDIYGKLMLPELLDKLCEIEGLHWIRILYGYPDTITDELLDTMARQPQICKYIDIPLQHASGNILKRMNRRFDRESLTALMNRVREKIDGVTLRTTFITGFPGETEQDFEDLCVFIKEVQFDRLGCFPYSAEDGTPAAEFGEQVDDEVKRRRADIIMEEQMGIMEARNREKIGKTLEALVEGFDKKNKLYYGRTAADAPDIDGKVYFTSETALQAGDFVMVTIEDVIEYDLVGHTQEAN
ncbi:30S ribosomal protein S12 methylthiotransferase RimO [Hydrogenoanaerobacterium sp.]|uniref:30S ribosomal protein S12 methylthiotransferase RimO n=1 Tax=Hydrogenoanaerobacterium sp. TaxID=2953763 RepID=UPI00289B9845|nr:30S ribosomal protein S12 methylthiotransferase RimO [Hydrogenoanaerobacterium sp.]